MDRVSLSNIKTRHSKESKGLLVDIRYLKQKFTRENTFREDLSLQKEYLLILIGQLSRQYVLFVFFSVIWFDSESLGVLFFQTISCLRCDLSDGLPRPEARRPETTNPERSRARCHHDHPNQVWPFV